MQRVLVALMLGAAAAFQRSPVVRARVLAVFNQLTRLALLQPGRRGGAPQRSPRELKQRARAPENAAPCPAA